ncbi:nitrate/nitrite transporter [Ammoniphilus sp. 3BR4]|uniref:MFS transporter n=1 Tax=Ammoniphilus sp. 3BR4 TaxID=3158265 RepID=UPI0034664085
MKIKSQNSALLLSTLSMIVAFSVWSIFSPMAGELQKLYGLSSTEKSILIAIPVLLGSIMRIPMGIATDWMGGRKVYAAILLLLVIPLLGASFSQSYAGLLFWAFWIGMAGTTFAISIAYISKWYSPEKQGLVLGIAGIGNLGSAVASFSVPWLVSQWGIAWTFRLFAIALVLMAVFFWKGTSEHPRPMVKRSLKDSLFVVKYKDTWVLSLYYFLTFGGFVAFSVYLPVLLQEVHELSAIYAGFVTGVFVLAATLVRPLGGYLSDRHGAANILTTVFFVIFVSALAIGFGIENLLVFCMGCLVMAVTLGIGNGAVFKRVPEVSAGNTGAVTGFVGAAGGLGGFFPPILLGVIKDFSGDYTMGFILLSLLAVICLVLNSGFYKSSLHKQASLGR